MFHDFFSSISLCVFLRKLWSVLAQPLKRKETGAGAEAKPAKAPKAKAAKSEDGSASGGGGGGFRQPQHLSEALAELTGHKVLARTQVSTFLSTYIKENGLKNPANGREILWYGRARSAVDAMAFPSSVMFFFFFEHSNHIIFKKTDGNHCLLSHVVALPRVCRWFFTP